MGRFRTKCEEHSAAFVRPDSKRGGALNKTTTYIIAVNVCRTYDYRKCYSNREFNNETYLQDSELHCRFKSGFCETHLFGKETLQVITFQFITLCCTLLLFFNTAHSSVVVVCHVTSRTLNNNPLPPLYDTYKPKEDVSG